MAWTCYKQLERAFAVEQFNKTTQVTLKVIPVENVAFPLFTQKLLIFLDIFFYFNWLNAGSSLTTNH